MIFLFFFAFVQILVATTLATPTCPDGWTVLNDDTCVKFFSTPLRYRDAKISCQAYTGGHLVSIHNAIDDRILVNLAVSFGQTHPVWLGLTCPGSSWGTCAWEDQSGYTSDYNCFASGSPSSDIGPNAYILTTGNSIGRWVSADGDILSLAYFCEIPTNNQPAFCANEFNGFCYTMHITLANETVARETCHQECGELASIHSQDENYHIFGLYPRTTYQYQYRIGGRTTPDGTGRYWVDGTDFDYQNFDYFNEFNGQCVSVALVFDIIDAEGWMSNPCEEEIPFVCKRPKSAISCGSVPPTVSPKVVTVPTVAPTPTVTPYPEMCRHTMFDVGNGTVFSPYYPESFNPIMSWDCKYVFTTPPGTKAQMRFSPDSNVKLSTFNFYDQVQVSFGVEPFFTFKGEPPGFLISSTTNVIRMEFQRECEFRCKGEQWKADFGNNL